jgi:hypothetical protein
MSHVGRLACLCVLTLALGSFIPQPAAAGWGDLFGTTKTSTTSTTSSTDGAGGAVPIPGTLLLFAGGMAGLAWWRARRSQD